MVKKPKSSFSSASAQQIVTELLNKGEIEEALKKIRARLMRTPNDLWFLHEAARYSRRSGKLEDARKYYRRALKLLPRDPGLLNGMGLTYYDQGEFDEAETYYRRALAILPDYTACLNNYAILTHKIDRHEEARKLYEQLLKLEPDYVTARYGLASVLAHIQDLDGSQSQLELLLKQTPDDTRAQTALGMVLLQKGEYARGWPHYRNRYSDTNPDKFVNLPEIDRPYWKGEPLEGKSILIYPEQGLGDSLHFCRFVPRLKAEKGAKTVYLACYRNLYPLLKQLPGVDEFVIIEKDEKQTIPALNTWSTLLDLPYYFLDSTNPFGLMPPYLKADPDYLEKWPLETEPLKPLRIGLVWKGTPKHNNDRHRSLRHLEMLKPLWDVQGIDWISLQKGAGENEALEVPSDQPLRALGHLLNDYGDTAAVMTNLDLVITVDTSIAHLAGAMNIPCWVMIPGIGTDWRWLSGREETPWYPSMRLFNRARNTDGSETILRIRDELAHWTLDTLNQHQKVS